MAPHPTKALHLFNATRLRVIWNDLAARKVHDALVLPAKCDERLDIHTFVPVEYQALQLLLQCMQGLTEICEGATCPAGMLYTAVNSLQLTSCRVMLQHIATHNLHLHLCTTARANWPPWLKPTRLKPSSRSLSARKR